MSSSCAATPTRLSQFDLLEVVEEVPRAKVEYPASKFGGELGPYEVPYSG